MDTPAHPGTILFLEFWEGQEIARRVKPAETVPEQIRWHATPQGRVPVVQIVAVRAGPDQRVVEIHQYGPDGACLQTTIAAPPTPT